MVRQVVIVPCFDEEQRLPREAFLDHAAAHPDTRFLFVDDGSTDGTRAMLEEMRARSGGAIELLLLGENRGKAEAIRRGVLHAAAWRPAAFGYWDADLSTPLDQIEAFAAILDERPHVHVVLGSRVKLLGRDIRRSALRHYVGRVFATFASLALELPVYDTQCGAKLLRNTQGTRWLFRAPFLSRWVFDVEWLDRLGRLGRRRADHDPLRCVVEHPLPVWRDVPGSKIRWIDGVRAFWELLRIAARHRCAR